MIAWAYDNTNPLTPGTTPLGIANMHATPPATGSIISPQWAVAYEFEIDAAVFTAGESWVGNFTEFLFWLATNNGAQRTIGVQLSTPVLKNLWNKFSQMYPQYVT
jgi:hypothetical protein